jgi:hypothetical protein
MEYFAIADNGAYWAGADQYGELTTNAFDFCYHEPNICRGACPPNFNYGPVGFGTWQISGTDGNCGFLGLGGFQGTLDFQ